jgi:hypothetical protein
LKRLAVALCVFSFGIHNSYLIPSFGIRLTNSN